MLSAGNCGGERHQTAQNIQLKMQLSAHYLEIISSCSTAASSMSPYALNP